MTDNNPGTGGVRAIPADVPLDDAIDVTLDPPAPAPVAVPVAVAAAAAVPAPDTAKRPVIADKYIVERELARGAMGRVYLAMQRGLNRRVAVKVMSPKLGDPDFRRRFMLEATGLANLNHRNIVTVYDYGETSRGLLYLVLEYLEGRTLAKVLRDDGALSVARSFLFMTQLLRGLRSAHKKGVIHRDLKPSNLFVVAGEDGEEELKVLDFGVAKIFAADGAISGDATRDGMLLGTPQFMAPEQITGAGIGPGTDLYAAGCVLFNMLSARLPFTGSNDVEILHGHLKTPAPLLRTLPGCEAIPEAVEGFVARLLAKESADRFVDAEEALNALRDISNGLLVADVNFRAALTPDMAANLAASTGGSTGARSSLPSSSLPSSSLPSSSLGSSSLGSSIPSSLRALDTGAALAALSESALPAPVTTSTTDQPMTMSLAPAPPSRFNKIAAGLGLVATAVVAGVVVVALGFGSANHMVIETLPADLILVDEAGRVLGRSPLTLEPSDPQIVVRARIGESLSPAHTVVVAEGHVIVDFRADMPAPASSPVAAPAAAPPATPPAVVDVVEPASEAAPVATPAARPAPAPRPAQAAAPSAPAPAPAAPARTPSLRLDDDNPNIGLIDDSAPKVAPLD
jgi:serine/threonine protein kinase